MDKIQPLSYITDTDPVAQAIQDVSGWFKTEYMEITGNSQSAQYLEWYMAQGWTLLPSSSSTTTSDPYFRWLDGIAPANGTSYPSFEAIGFGVYTTTQYTTLGSQTFRGQYQVSTSTTSVYNLSRRKMQSELVLQDLVTDFTNAYNEGREINDQRYDEIVQIWSVTLDKTEDEIDSLGTDTDAYDIIIDGIIDKLPEDLDSFEDNISDILDDYGDSRRAAIAVRFNSELAKARQDLINRGIYNTTTWNSVSAGIEREREQALTDFEDTLVERKVDIQLALLNARTKIREAMLDAHNRWMAMRRDNRFAPLELRNNVLKSMLAFMERRTDSYPGIDSLAGMAAQLGFSEGASTVAPTS